MAASGRDRLGRARRLRELRKTPEVVARLKHVAHVGQLFIDGDACERALRPAARAWISGDDFDYDFDVAAPLKQTLMRLERIEAFPYTAVIWRRRPDDGNKAEVLLAGRLGSPYGRGPMTMPAGLRRALVDGRVAVARVSAAAYDRSLPRRYGHVWQADRDDLVRTGQSHVVSVFAPIRNSNDDLVAALELATTGRDG